MSAELAITLTTVGVGFLLAYIAFNFNEKHAEIKTFFVCLSLLFIGVSIYYIGLIAEAAEYDGVAGVNWMVLLVWVVLIVLFIIYLVMMFMKDSIDLATYGEWRWGT